MTGKTIRLTMAQALVRYFCHQFTEIDGERAPLFAGVFGSTSANVLAGEADVIVAIGTRLEDFTTGSWTAFAEGARLISINAARFDAIKHRALAVVRDALETVRLGCSAGMGHG